MSQILFPQGDSETARAFVPLIALDADGLTALLPGNDSPQTRISWSELDRLRDELTPLRPAEGLQGLINWYWGAMLVLTDVRFGSVRHPATQRVFLYCKYQLERLAQIAEERQLTK